MCCWNFSYNKAKIIKKSGTLPTFWCKITCLMCQNEAQLGVAAKNVAMLYQPDARTCTNRMPELVPTGRQNFARDASF